MADHEASTTTPLLSTAAYDVVRFLAQVLFPALGTAYAAIALIWGFGYSVQVLGTIAAVDTLLAVVLGISKASFQASGADGTITTNGTVAFTDPSVLQKDTIVLTNSAIAPVPAVLPISGVNTDSQ